MRGGEMYSLMQLNCLYKKNHVLDGIVKTAYFTVRGKKTVTFTIGSSWSVSTSLDIYIRKTTYVTWNDKHVQTRSLPSTQKHFLDWSHSQPRSQATLKHILKCFLSLGSLLNALGWEWGQVTRIKPSLEIFTLTITHPFQTLMVFRRTLHCYVDV